MAELWLRTDSNGQVTECFLPTERRCVVKGCGKNYTLEEEDDTRMYCPECQATLIVCYHCGNEIVERTTKNIGGRVVCENCVDMHYCKCRDCGEYYEMEGEREGTMETFCPDCRPKWKECDSCGSVRKRVELRRYQDEYQSFDSACEDCRERMKTTISINPAISKEAKKKFTEKLLRKKIPKISMVNSFMVEDDEPKLKELVKRLKALGWHPKRDIVLYLYPTSAREYSIKMYGKFFDDQKGVRVGLCSGQEVGLYLGKPRMGYEHTIGFDNRLVKRVSKVAFLVDFLKTFCILVGRR